jgi:hypothetical protein
MTRNGKIARLPHKVREELNQRIYDGTSGRRLVAWLNTLPAVEEMLRADFDGRPLREQSLSEWKKRGYREWLAFRQVSDKPADAPCRTLGELAATAGKSLLMLARAKMANATDDEERFRIVRELGIDLDILRRRDLEADRRT